MEPTAIMDRLGLRWPIIQAPMAGVSSPAMAAAVTRAGGLGSLGLGASGVAQARHMIHEFRAGADGPLNVNFFCHQPATANAQTEAAWLRKLAPLFDRFDAQPPEKLSEIYQSFLTHSDMQSMLLEERPEVISFHFGLPAPEVLRELRKTGAYLMASATSLPEALLIQEAGLDAVIAQGTEAGGHRGIFDPNGNDDHLGCLTLTQILADRLDIPVISAGGLMTGGAVASALAAGASAAQLGTAFIACPESLADQDYRTALVSDQGHHTRLTPAVSGRPARCLGNPYLQWAADIAPSEVPDYPIAYDAAKALAAAAKAKGAPGFGAQWAGQGAPLARSLPAGELIAALGRELDVALQF
jgi:nitronate monooxygenase